MKSALPSPDLLSYDEAAALVGDCVLRLGKCRPAIETVELERAMGRVLARPLAADLDQPPFARSTRDGFACREAEACTHKFLTIAGTTRAGLVPAGPLPPRAAWEIMTGAPVPAGADAVVMLEHVEVDAGRVRLLPPRKVEPGENIVAQGAQARAGDELAVAQRQKTLQRNFQGYSTRGGADICAFGMSSISQAEGFYWQNLKELPAYYGALDAGKLPLHRGYVMTAEDKIRRTTIMRLMCDLGLDYDDMSKRLALNFKEHFACEIESLHDMESDGLLVKTPVGLIVTDLGRLLIRNIAMRFDAYAGVRKENRFSRTI